MNRVKGHPIEDRSNRFDMAARGACSGFPGILTHGQSPHYYLNSAQRVGGSSPSECANNYKHLLEIVRSKNSQVATQKTFELT